MNDHCGVWKLSISLAHLPDASNWPHTYSYGNFEGVFGDVQMKCELVFSTIETVEIVCFSGKSAPKKAKLGLSPNKVIDAFFYDTCDTIHMYYNHLERMKSTTNIMPPNWSGSTIIWKSTAFNQEGGAISAR